MIEFENIHVAFNRNTAIEKRALQGLTLSIQPGEFVCVIGSNGAGKSTLLNTLCGGTSPHQGRLVINGQDVTSLSSADQAHHVARVFQDPMAGTCANLTIEENMALALGRGRRRGLNPAITSEDRKLFQSHLARLKLGLENRLTAPIGLLSGGQRQAISLIMATLSPMKVLALDEHTAALDPKTSAFILDLTKKIVSEKKLTTLMVTHSMHQALEMGDRTVMLHEGRVIFDIKGEEKNRLNTQDLLDLFHKASGSDLDDDSLLLN